MCMHGHMLCEDLCMLLFLIPHCISFTFVAVKSHPFGSEFDSTYVSIFSSHPYLYSCYITERFLKCVQKYSQVV